MLLGLPPQLLPGSYGLGKIEKGLVGLLVGMLEPAVRVEVVWTKEEEREGMCEEDQDWEALEGCLDSGSGPPERLGSCLPRPGSCWRLTSPRRVRRRCEAMPLLPWRGKALGGRRGPRCSCLRSVCDGGSGLLLRGRLRHGGSGAVVGRVVGLQGVEVCGLGL